MKRFLTLAFVLLLAVSLVSCNSLGTQRPSGSESDAGSSQQTTSSSQPSGGDTSAPDTSQETTSVSQQNGDESSGSDWLATKTGRFYSQFTGKKMYMEYQTEQEGKVMTVISAISGDKNYMETKVDGELLGATLIDGEYLYSIDHSSKTIIKMHYDGTDVDDAMLDEEDVDLSNIVKGTREIDGKTYDTEEWIVEDGKSILCFDGDKPAYIISEFDGMEFALKILKVSNQVNNSLFELPSGYEIISM